MNTPSTNLLELLISLYADQNNIKITYELKEKEHDICAMAKGG